MPFSTDDLKKEAIRHEAIARRLRELIRLYETQTGETENSHSISGSVQAHLPFNGHMPQPTKLNQLIEWLKKNGPATYTEMMAKSGIKRGTLAHILWRDKGTNFTKTKDRRW